jgi:hypothetical protein
MLWGVHHRWCVGNPSMLSGLPIDAMEVPHRCYRRCPLKVSVVATVESDSGFRFEWRSERRSLHIAAFLMKVVADDIVDAVQCPELVRAHGTLAILVLQDPFDDQSRRADDERAMIAEEIGLHDRL